MKVKTKLRLDQEKILHDDNIVKRSQRYDNYYESICHCSGKNCGSYCNSKIGSGSNGSIRICRNRKNNQLVAVKQVKSTVRSWIGGFRSWKFRILVIFMESWYLMEQKKGIKLQIVLDILYSKDELLQMFNRGYE